MDEEYICCLIFIISKICKYLSKKCKELKEKIKGGNRSRGIDCYDI